MYYWKVTLGNYWSTDDLQTHLKIDGSCCSHFNTIYGIFIFWRLTVLCVHKMPIMKFLANIYKHVFFIAIFLPPWFVISMTEENAWFHKCNCKNHGFMAHHLGRGSVMYVLQVTSAILYGLWNPSQVILVRHLVADLAGGLSLHLCSSSFCSFSTWSALCEAQGIICSRICFSLRVSHASYFLFHHH